MELVVDANILAAALIKNSKTRELIFDKHINLYAPDYLLLEFEKHKKYIHNKTRLDEKWFNELFNILRIRIKMVPPLDFMDVWSQAEAICPDIDDVPYFALALKLDIPLWSNDKRLKGQKQVMIYNTDEIMGLLKEN